MHSGCHRTFPFVEFEYTRNWIADSKKRILARGCWIDLTSRPRWRPETLLCGTPDRNKADLHPLIQRAGDPAQHCQRVAFVIGVLKAADDQCSGADELAKVEFG
jgi:hypothetical protein